MKPVEIALYIITLIFVELSLDIFLGYIIPKIKKKEVENEVNAQEKHHVKFNKSFINVFIIFAVITDIVGIVIFAFPNFITNILGFNYIATIILWWLPLIFDNLILYFMLTEATYNETSITVKKVFFKPKTYKFDEIESFTTAGNIKIKTTKGKILLLNAMSGTNSLRKVLSQKCKANKK